ncbi:hypothetical protein C8R44DRAFT_877645 [Mycena epipterygia]|nr:hypothetical protein C8R44DRAFT_877645 [Mycena epipterygia]
MSLAARAIRTPNVTTWGALNKTIGGRLVEVVPSAKYCASLPGGACTDAQWASSLFRNTIPSAINQGYDLTPPSPCLRNATTCGRGDVPLYSVEAETVTDIQAAVKFASAHNLRLAVKSYGHDYLGHSTAPNSLLIRTTKFQNISFIDNFSVGSQNLGSVVTTKANDKSMVGGTAATVAAAGGYVQGAGHSAVAPLFGLAADNVLEFHVVSDSLIELFVLSNAAAGTLVTIHAEHIFDFDSLRGGHSALLAPFMSAALAVSGVSFLLEQDTYVSINDALYNTDDSRACDGWNGVRTALEFWCDAFSAILEQAVHLHSVPIPGRKNSHSFASQVAANANISNGVHPTWRTTKADAGIDAVRNEFQIPILEQLSGANAGAYSATSRAMMRDFPQELIDKIIDDWHLVDPSGMKQCSLVCKRWVFRSRYNLFSNVYLTTENLRPFVEFVKTSSPPILSFVRHLVLSFWDLPLNASHLAQIHHCPKLTHIELRIRHTGGNHSSTVDWLESLQTHLRAWSANSGSLSRLDLSVTSGTTSLRTVVDLIACLPSLETLGISGPGSILADTTAHPSPGPTRLAHLELSVQMSSLIFPWLLSLPVVPILKSLRLMIHRYEDNAIALSATKAYFQRAGEGLESLDIAGLHSWTDSVQLQRGILPHTPGLQSLTFSSQHVSNILDTLALLPPSCTQINVHLLQRINGPHWSVLDAALAVSHTLRRFSVLEYDGRGLIITPAVRHLMPRANARGILA